MIAHPIAALTSAAAALIVASGAYALTLTNRDTVEQRVQITEGDDEAVSRDVVLAAYQILDDLCEDGCTIALDSGAEESFDGYEDVYIENGRFVIAE